MEKLRPMKISRALILLSALALPLAALAAETVYPPGSRIGLVPPKEMTPSKRFTGFEDARRGNALTFLEMPPEAFRELAAGFKPEDMKTQGFDLKTREDLKIHDRNAVLISGLQNAAGGTVRKWLLVVEDPSLTAFVVGQAMVDPTSLPDEEMRAALATLDVRPALGIEEQLAALPFRLPERAGFRAVRVMGGNAVFLTDGPKDVVPAAEQPIVIIAQGTAPAPPAAQRDGFARSVLFTNNIFKDVLIERSQGFRQKGADWHEIVARGNDVQFGTPVVLTQTIRFAPDGYVRMLGVVRADAREAVLPRFRSIFDGVQVE
jgi:hypothetical protein